MIRRLWSRFDSWLTRMGRSYAGLDAGSKVWRRKNPAARVKYRTGRPPVVLKHGKATTYRNHACRCIPCHDAAMADQRARRARKAAA